MVWPIGTKFGTVMQFGPFELFDDYNFENPRWRRSPSWKIEKSPYPSICLTDLHEILYTAQFDPLDPSDHYNFENLKIQDGGLRHFEKSQDHHIPEMVSPITAKLGKVMHTLSSWTRWPSKFWNFINPRWWRSPFWQKNEKPIVWLIFIILHL